MTLGKDYYFKIPSVILICLHIKFSLALTSWYAHSLLRCVCSYCNAILLLNERDTSESLPVPLPLWGYFGWPNRLTDLFHIVQIDFYTPCWLAVWELFWHSGWLQGIILDWFSICETFVQSWPSNLIHHIATSYLAYRYLFSNMNWVFAGFF
jgi:hypothetical protein